MEKWKYFFELNGQPRIITVSNRTAEPNREAFRRAEEQNDSRVGAPMPGTISNVIAKVGTTVRSGDLLMTIEAMKMETSLCAVVDGTVREVLVQPGDVVAANQLAIQLRFLFDVSTPSVGLVSASPKRPRDDFRRLDTPLCELDGDAADFLDRPAD